VTVSELIKLLEGYPPEMTVTIPGYEGGYCGKIGPIEIVSACDLGEDTWIWGRYDHANGRRPDLQILAIGGRRGQRALPG
jgi:hypothetical protein